MDWGRRQVGGRGHGLPGMVMGVVIRSSARLVALLACLELYYLLLHVVARIPPAAAAAAHGALTVPTYFTIKLIAFRSICALQTGAATFMHFN